MATMTIRGTYALDVDTVHRLEDLARQWGVSKSEALRRAIRAAGEAGRAPKTRLALLGRLQQTAGLSERQVEEWVDAVGTERRRSSVRRNRNR